MIPHLQPEAEKLIATNLAQDRLHSRIDRTQREILAREPEISRDDVLRFYA
jgi:hypothetical protein